MQWVYLRLSESFVFSPSLYIGTNNGLWTFLNEIARDTLFSSDELFQFVEVTESSGDYCNATNYASFFDAAANELIVLDTETYGSPDFPQSTPVSVPPGLTFVAMVNNADWLDRLGYIEFLRDIGKYFTINTMVKQETVARRLTNEQPYTFLEFNYLLLQSYDFLELSRRHGFDRAQHGSTPSLRSAVPWLSRL